MALGAELKEARMRKKLTASEVASGTRMKVQTVAALEEEDFSSMAAPIYAKGFIKLYAEFVGLDSQKLVAEYVARFVEADEIPPPPAPEESAEPDLIAVSAEAPVDQARAARVATAAPAVEVENGEDSMPPRDDGELDLFAEVEPSSNERRGILMDEGYREAAVSWRDRLGQWLVGVVDALQQAGDAAGAACRRALGRGGKASGVWKRLGDVIAARRSELSQIDFKNLSARHMMALVGVLVLVLLVISSLSRCVRGGRGTGAAEESAPLSEAAEPVDLYLD